jgi:4-amino-4-deoxy-L-arabinose transferase-like glycosyltransferase
LSAVRETTIIVVLAVAALAARMAVASAVPLSPPVSDMLEYWEKAVYIATHGRLYENSWRMPGYPVALATMFSFRGGPSLEAARLFNAAAGTMAVLLTYWLARRSVGRRPSIAAALAMALYPSFLIYTTFIATEAVVTAPLLATLLASTFRSRRAAAIGGACAALATLVRPAGIALLPAVLVVHARRRGEDGELRWSIVPPAAAAVCFCIVLAPWWAHNARLHGRFVPLDTTGGINLLIGTGPLANGHWDWSAVSRLHVEYLPNVDTTTPAGSDQAAALARTSMLENPWSVIRLVPAKLSALFALEGREQAYLYSFGYFGPRDGRTVWLWGLSILAAFPLMVAAAVGGSVVRGGVADRVIVPCGLFLATTAVMHLVSFGDPRFHLPFVPVLAVLATGLARWQHGGVPWRGVVAAIVMLLLALVWREQLAVYWAALIRLTAPGGWNSQLSFDDLL